MGTRSPYSTLSTSNRKPKKLTNSNSSRDSSSFDTIYFKSKDSSHEITPNEPKSENDKLENIEQPTCPKQNRKQIFTYDNLDKLSYHNT